MPASTFQTASQTFARQFGEAGAHLQTIRQISKIIQHLWVMGDVPLQRLDRPAFATVGIVECDQPTLFPLLIGIARPRRQRGQPVPLSAETLAATDHPSPTLALLLFRDHRDLKAIGACAQARRFIGSDTTILGCERGRELMVLLRRANLLALPLKEPSRGLIRHSDFDRSDAGPRQPCEAPGPFQTASIGIARLHYARVVHYHQ